MNQSARLSRRRLLQAVTLSIVLPAASMRSTSARAADSAPLDPDSPEAKAVHYVEDAGKASASGGNNCASCALYQGSSGAAQGPCQIFPGKQVKAAGWCSAWAPQM